MRRRGEKKPFVTYPMVAGSKDWADYHLKTKLPALQPGVYEVRVEASGFEAAIIPKAEITVGTTAVYDIELQPAGMVDKTTLPSLSLAGAMYYPDPTRIWHANSTSWNAGSRS